MAWIISSISYCSGMLKYTDDNHIVTHIRGCVLEHGSNKTSLHTQTEMNFQAHIDTCIGFF